MVPYCLHVSHSLHRRTCFSTPHGPLLPPCVKFIAQAYLLLHTTWSLIASMCHIHCTGVLASPHHMVPYCLHVSRSLHRRTCFSTPHGPLLPPCVTSLHRHTCFSTPHGPLLPPCVTFNAQAYLQSVIRNNIIIEYKINKKQQRRIVSLVSYYVLQLAVSRVNTASRHTVARRYIYI